MKVGIVALQGNFAKHAEKAEYFGHTAEFVKTANQLGTVDALVLPGGESTAMLKLLEEDFVTTLMHCIQGGLPTLATCAGCILIAAEVLPQSQRTLNLIDITVHRNAYGSQINSFICDDLTWEIETSLPAPEGVFIRAPKITRVGPGVRVVLRHANLPVCVAHDNIMAATFHPEHSIGRNSLLELFYDRA